MAIGASCIKARDIFEAEIIVVFCILKEMQRNGWYNFLILNDSLLAYKIISKINAWDVNQSEVCKTCVYLLKAGNGQIHWCSTDHLSADDWLVKSARKFGVESFWSCNFPDKLTKLNCMDISM